MPKKIIVCIDGTNNEIGDRETNVLRLYKGLKQTADQHVRYIMGVGTFDNQKLLGRMKQTVLSMLGQAFGYGLEDDVLDGYRYICRTYDHGRFGETRPDWDKDQIYLVGFSRGAYGARLLAGFIHNFGLVPEDRLHLIAPVFRAYRRVSDARPGESWDVTYKALREYDNALRPLQVPIRALLLFDTVSSMIRIRRVLHNLWKHGSILEFGTHKNVDRNVSVRIVLQALALDERRSLFRPLFWDHDHPETGQFFGNRFRPAARRRTQFVRQRWFPGFHSDIGGSPPEDEAGIGKLTLSWMLDTLAALETEADAEDREKAGDRPHAAPPADMARGFELFASHRRNYWEGRTNRRTPGKLPYSAADPMAPIHDSHWPRSKPAAFLWHLLELVPKSAGRRERPPVAWFRSRVLWWYLPLKEPRRIPDQHEIDPSVWERREAIAGYRPDNLAGRGPRANP